ncbi:hypothetical protein P3W85_33800 [Cupriavidus basilensis]|uniref:Ap4A phosphorylase 1/2 N-terminal domain-containing protein n=1 Tax=Cupriavidus basilensis TaxID=68895 RepID=A0ABT6AZ29_9BURK|nr:hypothetical protein [Cupriavidus basilensis]MDF3837872.1 hypothetical protein [Cupriavidus basilensis]
MPRGNGGAAAGASQVHKHLQFVLLFAESCLALPIGLLLESARIAGRRPRLGICACVGATGSVCGARARDGVHAAQALPRTARCGWRAGGRCRPRTTPVCAVQPAGHVRRAA